MCETETEAEGDRVRETQQDRDLGHSTWGETQKRKWKVVDALGFFVGSFTGIYLL